MRHVSSTQVKTYERCPRKWWWAYVQKMPSAQSWSMTLGIQIHKDIEDHLSDGVAIPEDSLATAAIPKLPERSENILVEYAVNMPIEDTGIKYVGRVDIIDKSNVDEPAVIDIKTTSSIAKWSMKASALRADVQMNAYAMAVFLEHAPAADHVRLDHLYIQTKGRNLSKVVSVRLTREDVEAKWADIKDTVYRMVDIENEEFQNGIPANKSACSDYGGCPYLNVCSAASRRKRRS